MLTSDHCGKCLKDVMNYIESKIDDVEGFQPDCYSSAIIETIKKSTVKSLRKAITVLNKVRKDLVE